jgi:predicted transcriptional regulator
MDLVSGAYLPQADERKMVMTIRIAPSLMEKVEQVARSYDISTSSLVRMWIVDRLRSLES